MTFSGSEWRGLFAFATSAVALLSPMHGSAVTPDPFSLPVTPIQTVLNSAGEARYDQPVLVEGTVTLHHSEGPIFIQDGGAAIFASTRTNSSVRVGDRVQVVGFVYYDGFSPTLAKCVYRAIGRGAPIRPQMVTEDQLKTGAPDMRLVRVKGPLLVNPLARADSQVLHMRVGAILVSLTLDDFSSSPLSQLRAGSVLQASGVCSIGADSRKRPTAIRLHLRSGDDVVLLQGPPWWTPQRVAVALCSLAVLSAAAMGWMNLRRQRQMSLALEERVRARTAELEMVNRDLESFSYSVSHDLRAPLRAICGFSEALAEDYSAKLDETGQLQLQRIRGAAKHMNRLIDGLLSLARVTRSELHRESVDMTGAATAVVEELAHADPEAKVHVKIQPDMKDFVDGNLVRIVLANLLQNAWKFTSKAADRQVEVGCRNERRTPIYFVRDNGAGFDAADGKKLFQPFQRLHTVSEYAGTGIGLATVQKIVERHGGRVWAEGKVNHGACFFFTLHPDEVMRR